MDSPKYRDIPRVRCRDENGQVFTLVASWTSAPGEDPLVAQGAGRAHLRAEDMLRLVDLLARIQQEEGGNV